MQMQKSEGAYFSGIYKNLFNELLGQDDSIIKERIESAFQQLFYGNDSTQRVYYPVEPDMAYIEDVVAHDVRTEGISYGLMIAVQMDKKDEFDRLWKWARKYMQHSNGPYKGYFAWQCRTDGSIIENSPASDGEEWIVTALFFASARWGNGNDIFNYRAEAQKILDAMLSKEESSQNRDIVTNMFSRKEKQIVFVPFGKADSFTDPSYHTPHFYELWARWADKENQFWFDVASMSRQFLRRTVNPKTGLAPDYANFNGTPISHWGGGHEHFQFDAWRVAMNIAVDYEWFAKDDWQITQSNRLLNFFYSEGIRKYGNMYTLEGKKFSDDYSPGLAAMNAVAALASTNDNRIEFVKDLWRLPVPDGPWRYFDSMLYMLAMLQVSGNFKIYDPDKK
jgi:oligosaccharide reducing-end xylanase